MGSPPNEWGRGAYSEDRVAMTLTHDFMIGQHEVTQTEWKTAGYVDPSGLFGETGTGACTDDPACPVEGVNFYDVLAYANALSTRDHLQSCYDLSRCTGTVGKSFQCSAITLTTPTLFVCEGYRLPTQEEWEYAARAGTRSAFYSGEPTRQEDRYEAICCEDKALEPIAWYCHNAGGRTHPVGRKASNAWGLFDVAGNVEEWVNDPYTGGTTPGPLVDFGGELPSRPASLIMGGSFRSWATLLRHASDAIDQEWSVRSVGVGVGFRLVRSLPSRDR
jgi:formylglycine-generating enzyme required for sulfatase activity